MGVDERAFIRRALSGDGPAWRWRRAGQLVDFGRRPDAEDDPITVAAWQYRRAAASHGEAEADRRHPTLGGARRLHEAGGPARWELEARLLAGPPPAGGGRPWEAVMASPAGRAFAAVFFDVGDAPDASSWLLEHAVGFGPGWGPPTLDEGHLWRYAAFAVGHEAVEVLVADHLGLPAPRLAELGVTAALLRLMAEEFRAPFADHAASLRFVVGLRRSLAARVRAARSPAARRTLRRERAWLALHAKLFRAALRTGPGRRPRRRDAAGAGTAEPAYSLGPGPGPTGV